MKLEDIQLLKQEDIRKSISDNINADPAALALSLKSHAALVSSQVKYLQRCRTKLPSYYNARAIIPPLAFEQASGEKAASSKHYSGDLCIDLTCGLGVDSLYLSKTFGRVISIERDSVLAEAAAYNFTLLGAGNIEVVNDSAENFLQNTAIEKVDLIYVDPARRNEKNNKLVLLEDCSPDVLALLPRMRQLTGKLVIKASPLFDVNEAFNLFGDKGAVTVEVVSSQGECKEVIIEVDFRSTQPTQTIKATIAEEGSLEFPRTDGKKVGALPGRAEALPESGLGLGTDSGSGLGERSGSGSGENFSASYKYLLVPDVSLYKARVAKQYVEEKKGRMFSGNGYGFSDIAPENFMGTIFEIEEIVIFQQKRLKMLFKTRGIRKITVHKKDFHIKSKDIISQLGVGYGEDSHIAFTSVHGKSYAVLLKK